MHDCSSLIADGHAAEDCSAGDDQLGRLHVGVGFGMDSLVVETAEDADALGADFPVFGNTDLDPAENSVHIEYGFVYCDGGPPQVEANTAKNRHDVAAPEILVVDGSFRAAEDRHDIENGLIRYRRAFQITPAIQCPDQQTEPERDDEQRPDVAEVECDDVEVIEQQ